MNLWTAATGRASRMSYVNRFSSFPMNRRENVAEHSWWVTFIAYLICCDFLDTGIDVNVAEVLQRGICHDLNECMSGDIIRSYKYSDSDVKGAMDLADRLNMDQLVVNDFGTAALNVHMSWLEAKKEGIEGDIIRFADMASVVFYLREEHQMGNTHHAMSLVAEMHQKWFDEFYHHPALAKYAYQIFPNEVWGDAFRPAALPRFERGHPMMKDHSEGPTATASSDYSRSDRVPLS